MKFQPKKTKYKYSYKKKTVYLTKKFSTLQYGSYGLQATNYGNLEADSLEALRKVLKRYSTSNNFPIYIYFRVSFQVPLTKKSLGVRMGKGKAKKINK